MLKRIKKKVLIVEDDVNLAKVIAAHVQEIGLLPTVKFTGTAGIEATKYKYDLIISDISLPGASGFKILESLLKNKIKVPVIIITSIDKLQNELLAYKTGANIFHSKPINFTLLKAQADMLVSKFDATKEFLLGDLFVSPSSRAIKRANKDIVLSPKEFDCLMVFINNPGSVLTRRQILDFLATDGEELQESSIDTLISRLRKKVGKYEKGEIIETVYKRGYRLGKTYLL